MNRETEAAWRTVLGTNVGRALIWRLLMQTGLLSAETGTDAVSMARSAGRRQVGATLFREIRDAAPEECGKMLIENVNEADNVHT